MTGQLASFAAEKLQRLKDIIDSTFSNNKKAGRLTSLALALCVLNLLVLLVHVL